MSDAFGPHARTPGELAAVQRLRRAGEPFLELRDGAGSQRLIALRSEKLSLGRSGACAIALDWDEEVSRLHALIEQIDGAWVVEDAGSRNGTLLNGVPVPGRRLLGDGDVVRAGRTPILFHSVERAAAERTHAAQPRAVPSLTAAQRRVLEALCRPWLAGRAAPAGNREIAAELVLSEDTVKTHMRALFAAFEVAGLGQYHKRAELARRAAEAGAVGPAARI